MIAKKNFDIIIADDHPMILKGLFEELTANNYCVIGQASDGMQALEMILKKKPTLALLDIDMPYLTGLEVIKICKEKGCDTKFIILTFYKESAFVTQAKSLQINGYLLKEDSIFEMKCCISAVLNNEAYFSRSFDNSSLKSACEELQKLQFLTPSETTILKLISQQKSTRIIAENLCVSSRTVEKHRSNILIKLAIDRRTNSLTNWALLNNKIILEL